MSDFKAKMHKILFPLGLCPRPRWGSLDRSPRPQPYLRGPTCKRKEGEEGGEWQGKGRAEEGKGEEGGQPPNILT